jgi:ABC-type transport system involved in multi-copper enzyme maturation permease subunit
MPIFDQGYQHWQGQLSGHGSRWLAVARHGVRGQLGNRFVRLLMLAAWLPALVLVGFVTLWGLMEQQAEAVVGLLGRILPPEIVADPQQYRSAAWTVAYSYFLKAELVFALFLVLLVGPNLVSRDLRFNAFPLYFSRPVRRIDYFAGKLAVIGFFLLAIIVVPAAGAYLLGLGFSLSLGVARDTYRVLWASVLFGLLVAVSAGTLMLALSSLSRRSIYVGLAWAGLVFLSQMLATIMLGVRGDIDRRSAVEDGMAGWVKDHPPPPGIQVGPGPYSYPRNIPTNTDPRDPKAAEEEKARQKWMQDWQAANRRAWSEGMAAAEARRSSDWPAVLSYSNNLDRLADALLGTDAAWEQLGRTAEAMGPGGGSRSRRGPAPTAPAADDPAAGRRLADERVWQFPWYWSAGVLAGVWLLSAFILSRRVKSLDRLK